MPIILLLLVLIFSSPVYAKDLYVATTGSDSTTYAANDISHPWLTAAHAWVTAQLGDTVYYRTGTYTFTSILDLHGYADTVEHKNYNGEAVTWDAAPSLTGKVIKVGQDYITVDGITIDHSGLTDHYGFFDLGEDYSATHFTLKNARCYIGTGTDNTGIIYARYEAANYLTVENCHITGGGAAVGSVNNAGIWVDGTQYVTIKNNEISDVQVGFLFKHSNARVEGAGPLLENNYIHDCDYAGVFLTSNYSVVRNNLFVNAHTRSGQDAGAGSGGVGSDYNEYRHNTYYNSRWRTSCQGTGDPGATNNTVQDNIFVGYPMSPEYESTCSEDMALTSDYNLFPASPSVQYRNTTYTLANWKSVLSTDTNSFSGSPTFVDATPTDIAEFALTSESTGYQAASDSEDIGADVSLIGTGVEADTTAPTITASSVNGTVVTITASETITTTGYDANDCALTCATTGTVNLTSPTGAGASRIFTGSASVANGDTCTLGCTLAAGDITDAADPANDMITFGQMSVTVNTPMVHGAHFGPSAGGGWRNAAGQVFAPAQ